MRVPVVNSCCCGCSLQTGTTIIGWLEFVGGIFLVISGIGGLAVKSSRDAMGAAYGYLLILGIIGVLFSLLLLIGTKRRLPKYLQIWVVVTTIFACISFISIIANTVYGMINHNTSAAVGGLAGGLFNILLTLYFVVVVFNFKREMMNENPGV